MKSKRGFTLIEVIAVILVLAIISFIGFNIVSDVIEVVSVKKEIQNAGTLSKMVHDYLVMEEMNGNTNFKNKYYIIENDVEYTIGNDGQRVKSKTFKYRYKLCDYCIIKIKDKNNYSVLLEGKKQDVKAGSNINGVEVIPLEHTREVTSNYNELLLFKDIYTSNNELEVSKFLEVNDNKIIEIDNSGNKTVVYTLTNSKGTGTITIKDSSDFLITVETEEKDIIEINSDNNVTIVDNINKKDYSDEILNLYSSLKTMAKRYIANNEIKEDVYFEFNDGDISIIDSYGEKIANNSVYIDKTLTGSGELTINPLGQIQVVIYEDDYDIKNNFGSDDLYNQPLKYERDNVILFKNLSRLQKLAIKYLGGDTYTKYDIAHGNISDSKWLVFFYIRRLKYNSDSYNEVTGNDSKFYTYVNNNNSYLKNYFTSKNTFTINGDTIDLKHMAASLAGNMYNTDGIVQFLMGYEELELDCAVSWGGDLHQFMESDILKSGIKTKYGSYTNAVYDMLGKASTGFSMEDIYADVDEWNIYYNMRENKVLTVEQVFDAYYSGTASRNYKNRYTSFIKIMDSVAKDSTINKTDFSGLVKHFTNVDKGWDTLGTLAITPTEAEEVEIANGFIKWMKDKVNLE